MSESLDRVSSRLASLEQRQQENAAHLAASFARIEYLRDFVLAVLGIIAETECYDIVYWSCRGEYAPLTFWVNCNDLFWWATADAEKIEGRADVEALRQAIADVQAVDPSCEKYWGFLLWCARKRKRRPQQPAYPQKSEALRTLFDACGPVRTPQEEG